MVKLVSMIAVAVLLAACAGQSKKNLSEFERKFDRSTQSSLERARNNRGGP